MPLPRRHVVVLAVVLVALTVHFSMTLLYLAPPTPLKRALAGVPDRYMAPFFEQRWDLFAPNPVKDSRIVLIACRTTGDTSAEPVWHDITRPLLDAKYATRVTPADRLHRAVQGASAMMFSAPRPVVDRMRETPELFVEELAAIDRGIADQRVQGQRLLTRIGSAACDRILGPGRTAAVRARILLLDPPPYSKRHQDDRQSTARVVDFPWHDHERVAAL